MPPIVLDPDQKAFIEAMAEAIAEANRKIITPDRLVPTLTEQSRPGLRAITIPLDTARTVEEIPISGRGMACIDATDGNASASVFFNSQQINQTAAPLKRGIRYVVSFQKFWLTNSAQPGKTLTRLIPDTETFFGENQNLQSLTTIDTITSITNGTDIPSGFAEKDVKRFVTTAEAATTSFTIYTVPAGKTARVTMAQLFCSNSPGGDIAVDAFVETSAAVRRFTLAGQNMQAGDGENTANHFTPSFLLAAGDVIKVTKPAAAVVIFFMARVYEQV